MSIHVARALGKAFEAINYLQVNGLLSDTEARKAMKRLGERARKNGVDVAITNPAGERLFRQIRIYWTARGKRIDQYYPNYKGV